ncbi:hypothetical protein BLIN9172_02936 [Brevibacterium linens ATCC 9172]|uniref:Uncharacterized protein n=1 Tax=Brevibacterium linens ATCC 9172 TaxID=1255617 RepID=A0A2H1K9M1_BRELN|nr:hypothetical protein BLIN9172_02936 [Brevibacterium linens ATCC 9172]
MRVSQGKLRTDRPELRCAAAQSRAAAQGPTGSPANRQSALNKTALNSRPAGSQMVTAPFSVLKLTDMMPGIPWGADQSMLISEIGLAS